MNNTARIWILLAKKKANEASVQELDELQRLQDEQRLQGHAAEVFDKVWEAPLVTDDNARPDARVWEKLQKRIAQPVTHPMFSRPSRYVAAATVLVLVGSSVFWFGHRKEGAKEDAIAKNRNQYTTQPGSKSKLELPDGTQVWLNGNSRLSVGNGSFGSATREVYLSGEAFFDVARNERSPFIIHTGTIDITVLGTAFNVKAYPGEKNVETALVRGLIEITTHNDPDRRIMLKPNEKIIIPTDTMIARTPTTTQTIAPAVYAITALHTGKTGILPETVWMQRKLEFDNEPFSELAPKMEEWFDIKIKFGSEAVRNKRFSGVIENETLEETLKDMRLSTPFTYTLNGNELSIH
jgi:ferric-dicitrate binding protein FerR (iron transport regulator)